MERWEFLRRLPTRWSRASSDDRIPRDLKVRGLQRFGAGRNLGRPGTRKGVGTGTGVGVLRLGEVPGIGTARFQRG